MVTATGAIGGRKCVVGVLDSRFFMGSMSAAVGEKITLAIEYATKNRLPLILFAASGCPDAGGHPLPDADGQDQCGAGPVSRRKGFCIFPSLRTPPLAGSLPLRLSGRYHPGGARALIGFAGPRVIQQTIGQTLPEGFQRAEFQEEHGFVDAVVPRLQMRDTLSQLLRLHEKGDAHERTADRRPAGGHCPPPQRPNITDYIQALFTDFFEQKGDRLCGEDAAILGGVALYHGRPVTVIGTRKGKTLEENLKCNFGMPNPEGYRKALRLMRQAEKFRRPILTFIDTSGAYPGLEAEATARARPSPGISMR